MPNYVIGIDIGTQGTKSALIRDDGVIISESFFPSRLIQPTPNVVEQDPDEILLSCIKTIKDVVEQSSVNVSDIVCIALDGQMAGVMGIDKDGWSVTPYDSWLDQRCGSYWETLRSYGEDRIIQLTGCPITYAHGPKILWWKHERPDVYNKIRSFIQPAAYVAMRMCDLKADQAFIDHTYLHFSGFADLEKRAWSDELLDSFSIDMAKMPRIVRPYDIVGKLSQSMSEMTSLRAGLPIAAGCGDTSASIFGAGVTQPGTIIDVAGTASVFACAVNQYVPDVKNKTLMYAPSVLDGLYTPMAYINGGGLCIKWFKDEILSSENVKVEYSELEREASKIPAGSEQLLFIPHFSGRVCPNDGYIRGSWLGLSFHHKRGHMYRSIMEGIAFEYKIYLDIIQRSIHGFEANKVLSVGGGSKSSLMRQIKADILGIPLATISRSDTGVLGTGIIAGYAVGLFDSLSGTVEKFVKPVSEDIPDKSLFQTYHKQIQAYAESFGALKAVYNRLL